MCAANAGKFDPNEVGPDGLAVSPSHEDGPVPNPSLHEHVDGWLAIGGHCATIRNDLPVQLEERAEVIPLHGANGHFRSSHPASVAD